MLSGQRKFSLPLVFRPVAKLIAEPRFSRPQLWQIEFFPNPRALSMNSFRGSKTGGYDHLRVAAIGNAEQSAASSVRCRAACRSPNGASGSANDRNRSSAILVCHAATHSGIFTIDAVEFCDLEPHGVLSDLTHSVLLLG